MRIKKLKTTNFKTLNNHSINLAGITILAGANSVGKSSTIQCLLFLRSLIDKIKSKELDNSKGQLRIPLNGPYMLSLGCTKEVISWEAGKSFNIEIFTEDDTEISFLFNVENLELTNYFAFASYPDLKPYNLNLIKSDFFYLNAERFGPRIQHGVNESLTDVHCGFQGEYTTELLARIGNEIGNIVPEKFLKNKQLDGAQTLALYTRQWLSYIVPDTDLGNAEIFGTIRSTTLKFNSFFSAPNVGFGISYILPIIVNGLIAKKDALFIVENPEAHLHPKGQSRIGYFLGCMASTGIQIIVETHSEHVINGIRLACVEKKVTTEKDVLINFYYKEQGSKNIAIKEISVNEFGDLSDFPFDFFDQAQQDLLEIMQLSRN